MAEQGAGILQVYVNPPSDVPPVVVTGKGAVDPPVFRNQQ